jgi:hypothetical protein
VEGFKQGQTSADACSLRRSLRCHSICVILDTGRINVDKTAEMCISYGMKRCMQDLRPNRKHQIDYFDGVRKSVDRWTNCIKKQSDCAQNMEELGNFRFSFRIFYEVAVAELSQEFQLDLQSYVTT